MGNQMSGKTPRDSWHADMLSWWADMVMSFECQMLEADDECRLTSFLSAESPALLTTDGQPVTFSRSGLSLLLSWRWLVNCVYLLRLYLDRGNQSADLHQPMGGQRCEPGHQQANRGTAFSLLLSQVVQLRRDIRERWNYLPLLSIQWTIGTRPDTRQARVVTNVVRQCDVLGRYHKLVNLLKNIILTFFSDDDLMQRYVPSIYEWMVRWLPS